MRARAWLANPLLATSSFVVGVLLASMAALPAAAQTSDEETGAKIAKQVEEEIGIYEMPVTSLEAGTLVKIARREHYRR